MPARGTLPRGVRSALLNWYRVHGRHGLPWRATRDRYGVLISEVMLQQTQVSRVLPAWSAWMARWPDTDALARATPAEVIEAWAGMGYNRRALYLHRAAREAAEKHGSRMPGEPAALRRLAGIGPYTANAVACFASGRRIPVVDTNVARVIARLVLGLERARAGDRRLAEAAEGILPGRGARDWNLALMDLGADICTARAPECERCPVRRWCAWWEAGRPPEAPRVGRPAMRFEDTTRYVRGRLVDGLRSGPATAAVLSGAVGNSRRDDVPRTLAALEREGLIERREDGAWALPGDARQVRGG